MEEQKQGGNKTEKVIKGPCCVCKETKAARDNCLLLKSEEECKNQIELHIQCLIKEGFDPRK